MRLSKSRMREETDAGAEAMGRGSSAGACPLLLERESVKGSKRKDMCRDR